MIIFLHIVCYLIDKLMHRRKEDYSLINPFEVWNPNSYTKVSIQISTGHIRFSSSMNRRRHYFCYCVMLHPKWRKELKTLTDFGSSTGDFQSTLSECVGLTNLKLIDINGNDIELYVKYCGSRPNCVLDIYEGNAAEPDISLLGTDVVTAIELIEHLYPDTLDGFVYNVFHFVKPKLVIITTPNKEFNVVFPDQRAFRHSDHKFEWTRDQFESWSKNITIRYPDYVVYFNGIGTLNLETFEMAGYPDFGDIGFCTQAAVFVRRDLIDGSYSNDNSKCNCNQKEFGLVADNECLCRECTPASFGICTYYSCSQITIEPGCTLQVCKECNMRKNSINLINNYQHLGREIFGNDSEDSTLQEQLENILLQRLHQNLHTNYELEDDIRKVYFRHLCEGFDKIYPIISIQEAKEIYKSKGFEIEECGHIDDADGFSVLVRDFIPSETSSIKDESSSQSGWNTDDEVSDAVDMDKDQENSGLRASIPENKSTSAVIHSMRLNTNNVNLNIYNPSLDADPSDSPALSNANNQLMSCNNAPKIRHKVLTKVFNDDKDAGPSTKQMFKSQDEDNFTEIRNVLDCILENSLNKSPVNDNSQSNAAKTIEESAVKLEECINPTSIGPVLEYITNDLEDQLEEENDEFGHIDDEEAGEYYSRILSSLEVEWPSQEAIFDSDSHFQIDLFEDELDADESQEPRVESAAHQQKLGVLGLSALRPRVLGLLKQHRRSAKSLLYTQTVKDYINGLLGGIKYEPVCSKALLIEGSNFPNWLLQLLEMSEVPILEQLDLQGQHDEPHFYCQGDGLGVHPSVITVDDDDDDNGEDTDEEVNELDEENVDYDGDESSYQSATDTSTIQNESEHQIDLPLEERNGENQRNRRDEHNVIEYFFELDDTDS